MKKEEIALHLTLKVIETGKLCVGLNDPAYKDNAKEVWQFYNEVYCNIKDDAQEHETMTL